MSDDPIEAAAAENAEKAANAGNGTEAERVEERLEANEVDTFEQLIDLTGEEERTPLAPPSIEVNPTDAAEQHRVVPLDEDDYR